MELRDIQRGLLQGAGVPFDGNVESELFSFNPTPFRGAGRRINRFMLGADPEFVFEHNGSAIPATSAGLRPALAFGSDQNDRLVELRPHPYRSALNVVASTLAELRWMYRVVELTRGLVWRSGAFVHGDGLGGHVHFGRKKPTREAEVAGLDGLAKTMRRSRIFPNSEWDRRCKGDALGQLYGQYGDTRVQKHGYEYRTLPSWLDSPKLAFLVLTLSKLVIVDPEITAGWNERSSRDAFSLLRGLAKYYKGRDDDAWMLHSLMDSPEAFAFVGGDFKERWGLRGQPPIAQVIYPDCIAATKDDIEDVKRHLLTGEPIPFRETEANFRTTIPNGFSWLLPMINPNRRPGVGDLIFDFVTPNQGVGVRFHWDVDHHRTHISYPSNYSSRGELDKLVPEVDGYRVEFARGLANSNFEIYVGRDWRKGPKIGLLRKLFLSGVFPIWTVEKVQEDSHAKWMDKYLTGANSLNLQALFAERTT